MAGARLTQGAALSLPWLCLLAAALWGSGQSRQPPHQQQTAAAAAAAGGQRHQSGHSRPSRPQQHAPAGATASTAALLDRASRAGNRSGRCWKARGGRPGAAQLLQAGGHGALEHTLAGKDEQIYCHRCCEDADWTITKHDPKAGAFRPDCEQRRLNLSAEFELMEPWLKQFTDEEKANPPLTKCNDYAQAFEREVSVSFQPAKITVAIDRGVRRSCRADSATVYCEACWSPEGKVYYTSWLGKEDGWKPLAKGADIKWGDLCKWKDLRFSPVKIPMPELQMSLRGCTVAGGITEFQCCQKVWREIPDSDKQDFLYDQAWALASSHEYDDLDNWGGDQEELQDLQEYLEICNKQEQLDKSVAYQEGNIESCIGNTNAIHVAMHKWATMYLNHWCDWTITDNGHPLHAEYETKYRQVCESNHNGWVGTRKLVD